MLIFNDLISQSFYIKLGFTVSNLTFIIPVIYGSAGLIAAFSHKIENKLGENISLILITIFQNMRSLRHYIKR